MPRAHAMDGLAVAKVFKAGVIAELVCKLKPEPWAGHIADVVNLFQDFEIGPDCTLEFIKRQDAKYAVIYRQTWRPDGLGLFYHNIVSSNSLNIP